MENKNVISAKAEVPRWKMGSIYSGFESEGCIHDTGALDKVLSALEFSLKEPVTSDTFPGWLLGAITLRNEADSLLVSLSAYASCIYSADTNNGEALSRINALEEIALVRKGLEVSFRNILWSSRLLLDSAYSAAPELVSYKWLIDEDITARTRQMEPPLEELAEDMKRCGADAWSRLHQQVTSNLSIAWDEDAAGNPAGREHKTLNELRNMAYDSDRVIRKQAYHRELELLKSAEIPLAAAINGVKGSTVILNRRRNWENALSKSLFQSRISSKTLKALISAMEDSLPLWREYLSVKAGLLGIPRCSFYDLFAPAGSAAGKWSYPDAAALVTDCFSSFSPDMGELAKRAFSEGWIDAEIRRGKVGGAFCADFPKQKVSRVLTNFTGTFSDITTIAHELGHAYHHHCVKELPFAQAQYPMTLAETASIFAETIVLNRILSGAEPEAQLFLLETHLQDGCQVIVDILSRFYFESAVFEGREKNELSPAELCSLMEDAQIRTYGSALRRDELHP
ncbi:MAG: M3 family metallopeptidase [Spirochaetaceae bacterium]|jgi:pepF/M3 family oligoendopeptidase|nr:M3 family metallopeptidase [Spirochaetaceae bacterium]